MFSTILYISETCDKIKVISYKINNQINAPEVRVVDEKGENLGVMPAKKAMEMAEEKGLDLVEINSKSNPPITKIISFDKFRYQKEKEEKKQRLAQKGGELKRVRVTPRAARNDLQIKANQVDKFLEKNHNVEINLFLRGREKINKEWALQKLEEFLTMIKTPFKTVAEPKKGGRGFTMQIAKK